jgi:hypothetical protein
MGPPSSGWRDLLESYAAVLTNLSPPDLPIASWWHGLAPAHLDAWQTILPLLPGFAGEAAADRARQLESARRWALSRVSPLRAVNDGTVSYE